MEFKLAKYLCFQAIYAALVFLVFERLFLFLRLNIVTLLSKRDAVMHTGINFPNGLFFYGFVLISIVLGFFTKRRGWNLLTVLITEQVIILLVMVVVLYQILYNPFIEPFTHGK